VRAQLARARAKLEARAVNYADLHFQAATVAAARGDARPAEWGLAHLRVVEPIDKTSSAGGIVVQVGCVLPGLGRDPE